MRFVKRPNLPEARVETLLIGQKYAKMLEKPLKKLDVRLLTIPDNPNVDERMAGHADLSVVHAGGEHVICARHLMGGSFSDELMRLGFNVSFAQSAQGEKYPEDVNLNVCFIGGKLIGRICTVDGTIANFLTNADVDIININQGYARCAVCVVDEHSVITADPGIAAAVSAGGLDVLCVKSELAELPGFNCGFIGGAAFKLSNDLLAFTGRIADEGEEKRIMDFLEQRHVKAEYLTDERLFDIGGAIPVSERDSQRISACQQISSICSAFCFKPPPQIKQNIHIQWLPCRLTGEPLFHLKTHVLAPAKGADMARSALSGGVVFIAGPLGLLGRI